MTRVMLVQPWNYHDEGVAEHDLAHEWRNGPYALLLLATQLQKHGHEVVLVDMIRDLVMLRGDVDGLLTGFSQTIRSFRPDIVGFGFFSVHFFEVKRAVEVARRTCEEAGIDPVFIAGGIHASTEPQRTRTDLGFDYSFVGEADLGILAIADGQKPESVAGVVGADTLIQTKGEEIRPLDSLPFPDWSLCDSKFYGYPSYGKLKFRSSRSLDMIMSRGCVYKCGFCAYNALSAVRFYSADYLVDQVKYMASEYGINGVYFTDSTIGNNRKLVTSFSELMISSGMADQVEWYANMRANQVDEELLKLMWRGGCRFLFYGFESGSQRVLDLMVKGVKVEANFRAAELHNQLRFPYHASMLLGYPGEREEDIQATLAFVREAKPPIVGINWYVPLPGSPDYDKLKADGTITTDDPAEWRRIGEVNSARVYADIEEQRFRELFTEAEHLAYFDIPNTVQPEWASALAGVHTNDALQPPVSIGQNGVTLDQGRARSTFGTQVLKLLRSVRI